MGRGSEELYLSGLCLQKLGRDDEAKEKFEILIKSTDKKLKSKGAYIYFTQSLNVTLPYEHDLEKNNAAHCAYLYGLAWKGLGDTTKAKGYFEQAFGLKQYLYKEGGDHNINLTRI